MKAIKINKIVRNEIRKINKNFINNYSFNVVDMRYFSDNVIPIQVFINEDNKKTTYLIIYDTIEKKPLLYKLLKDNDYEWI